MNRKRTRPPAWTVLGVTAAAAAAVTIVVGTAESVRFAYETPGLRVALETTAALAALLVGYLALGRLGRSGDLGDALLATGLVVLAASNLILIALPSAVLENPSRFWTWAAVAGHLLGACVFAAGAFARGERLARPWRTVGAMLAACLVALGAVAAVLGGRARALPAAVDVAPRTAAAPDLSTHPALLAAQLFLAAAFAIAAVGFARRSGRVAGDELLTWLAAAAVLAAFARLHYSLYPQRSSAFVYTGDVFRLLFYVALLGGAAREIARYWRSLSQAAVLEERRRIARELHDGVAQELAYIARRARRAGQDGHGLAAEVEAAAARGLEDARQTISELSRPMDEPVDRALARRAADVAGRLGGRVEVSVAPGVRTPPEVREALVRIASEAVANAIRHGHAGVVRIELDGGERLRLRIVDDGAGFEPAAAEQATDAGYGLTSMRERAERLGGELTIASRPGAGTSVEVVVPWPRP